MRGFLGPSAQMIGRNALERICTVGVVLAAMAVALPASGAVIVDVSANSKESGPFSAGNEPVPPVQPDNVYSAAAYAGLFGLGGPIDGASVSTGPLGVLCGGGPLSCDDVLGSEAGIGRAEANGLTGSLKVRATARGDDGHGAAVARIQDVITFTGPSKTVGYDLHVSDVSASGAGFSSLFFAIGFFDNSNHDQPFVSVLEISVDPDGFVVVDGNGTLLDSGAGVPSSVDGVIDLDDFLPPFPPSLLIPISLEVRLAANANCFADGCRATVRADETAYLIITDPHISENGYLYPGLQSTEPPAGQVPTPAAGLIFAGGLAGLGWIRRRRTELGRAGWR